MAPNVPAIPGKSPLNIALASQEQDRVPAGSKVLLAPRHRLQGAPGPPRFPGTRS